MTKQACALLATVLFAVQTTAVIAADTSQAEIRALKERIEQLEKRVAQLEEQLAAKAVQLTGPPKIISTTPAVGATDVDPAIGEITVTFDRDMGSGFSWTGGGEKYPPSDKRKKAHWKDTRTAVFPVKLEEGHYYRVGINSQIYKNFRSAAGVPALPSAIYFTTRGASDELVAKTQKPVVVEMSPANGASAVNPQTAELRVTFSVPMGGGFSWTGGGSDFPQVSGKPKWTEDGCTCVLPVSLQPDHQYRLGLNSVSHKNFQSAGGVALDPVVYTFETGK